MECAAFGPDGARPAGLQNERPQGKAF